MNREEVRQLIGGYATNSLTDDERRLLFEAALEDQELFDALQDEQALKQLLDDPFSREQVRRAALAKPKQAWFRQPWIWAVSGIAVAALATFAVLLRPPTSLPASQVAQAINPAPISAPAPVSTAPTATAPPATVPPAPPREAALPRGTVASPVPAKPREPEIAKAADDASPALAGRREQAPAAAPPASVLDTKQDEERDKGLVTEKKKTAAAPVPPQQNIEARNQAGGPLENTNQQQQQQVNVQANKAQDAVTVNSESAAVSTQFRAGTTTPVPKAAVGSSFALMKAGLSPQVLIARKADNGMFLDAPPSAKFKPGDVVRLGIISPYAGQLAVEVKENAASSWTRLYPEGESRVSLSPGQRFNLPVTVTLKEDQQVQVVISRPGVGPLIIPVPLKVAQ
ncbi:MAG TPA: hypothetical protein VKU01_36085 [Bryobacteraceae bacterium]|nr:hypothetical protein [Bryobacteraceae bacterium]